MVELEYKVARKSFMVDDNRANYQVSLKRQFDDSGEVAPYSDNIYLDNLTKEQFDALKPDVVYKLSIKPIKK